MQTFRAYVHLGRGVLGLGAAALAVVGTAFRSRTALAAENLFLRKQLALYRERQVKPRRASDPMRIALVLLARCFAWREALVIVQPTTLLRWHRQAFRLLWRWRSRPGRPRLPADLRTLIGRMAEENPTWGQRRIAAELLLKLGIRVSPRTVRRYMPEGTRGGDGHSSQRWSTFMRNHAQMLLACDFCVAVTMTFRVLYIFVLMDMGSRRLVHFNVTAYPTSAWTLQGFREVLADDHPYRFVVHDRDGVYATPCAGPPWGRWGSASCAPQSGPRRPTPSASGSSGRSGGSAWTSSFRSARSTCGVFFACGGRTTIAAARTPASALAFRSHRSSRPCPRSLAIVSRVTRESWRDRSWAGSTTSTVSKGAQRDGAGVFADDRDAPTSRGGIYHDSGETTGSPITRPRRRKQS